MSRIGSLAIVVALLASPVAHAVEVAEWPAFDGVDLSTIHVAGRVFMVQRPGGGGNVGVYVGEEGVLVVDALFPALGPKIVAEIGKLTDLPIRFVVNTHIHPDHIGGNQALVERGAMVLAHDSVRAKMMNRLRWPRDNGSFGPAPDPAARPFLTYSDAISLHFDGEEVRALLAPNAHTDGDTFVYFPSANVLHLGDVFRTTSYPVIDVYNGGTLGGTLAALDLAVSMADADTKVIPGHGLQVVGRRELIEFTDMVAKVRDRVLALIRRGMNLEAVMREAPTADLDARWGQEAGWTAEDFLPIVYHELGGGPR